MLLALQIAWIIVLAHIAFTWIYAIQRGYKARKKQSGRLLSPSSLPAVSILIPAWRECGELEKCIESLKRSNYPNWEAIVLAGGPDGTYQAASKACNGDERFRVIERGPEPKNAALRRGVKESRFDILVFLDADCEVTEEWLGELLMPLAEGYSVSIGNRYPNRETWISCSEQMVNIQAYDILGERQIQGDRSFAMRRGTLEQIGGLPDHPYGREDWDLGMKWMNSGVKIGYSDKAILSTKRPATISEYWRNEIRWRRTHLNGMWEQRSVFFKHPNWLMQQIYSYLLSFGIGGLAIITIAGQIFEWPYRTLMVQFLTLILCWLCLRRASLAVTIAIFTSQARWIKWIWGPIALDLTTIPASIWATVTAWRGIPFDYKGPRTATG